jgi:hypothetical protein
LKIGCFVVLNVLSPGDEFCFPETIKGTFEMLDIDPGNFRLLNKDNNGFLVKNSEARQTLEIKYQEKKTVVKKKEGNLSQRIVIFPEKIKVKLLEGREAHV